MAKTNGLGGECGERTLRSGLTRRSFLKTTGAAVGVAALSGASFPGIAAHAAAEEGPAEESYVTFCRGNCGSFGCNLNVRVREGKVVKVSPQPYPDADPQTKGRGRACLRGLSNLQRLYAPERLDYPLRRVEGTERGAGEWERISWDEAIAEISEKWTQYLGEYGIGSVARYPVYGNNCLVNGASGIAWARLANTVGMSTIQTGADQALIYTAFAWANTLGNASDGPSLAENAKNIVVWGANPTETWPHEWRYVLLAQENGAKVTVVDPRVSLTAMKADRHIRPRHATDTALALGVCRYLIENDLIDATFLVSKSVAPCLVRDDGSILRKSAFGYTPNMLGMNYLTMQPYTDDTPYVWDEAKGEAVPFAEAEKPALSGEFEVEGQRVVTAFDKLKERVSEWTIERTCEICAVEEQDIVDLAEAFASGPTSVMVGNGAGHYTNSHTFFTSTYAIAILTGNFFKAGAGWGNAGVYGDMGWTLGTGWGYPQPMVAGPAYAAVDLPSIMDSKEYNGNPAIIKSVLVHSGNPLGNAPNRQAMIKAFSEIEFVVVVDMCMTDTARFADIVLPCGHWFEVLGAAGVQYVPYALIGEKAVEPMFERKSDLQMVLEIGKAMGFEERFNQTEEEVIAEAVNTSPFPDIEGNQITYERLKAEKNIRTLPDGLVPQTCATQDGLLMFYWENPVPRTMGKKIDVELERMPYFEPPAEAWPEDVAEYPANPLAATYPLILQNIHQRFTTHTTYNHVEWLKELRPEPVVNMNPIDAAERGISEGEYVKVFNDRGYVVVRAQMDTSLKPGSANLPHGWEADQFVEGHYQDLTPSLAHPFDDNECYFDCLCEIEKWNGGAE